MHMGIKKRKQLAKLLLRKSWSYVLHCLE